jgi:putative transcriptional regulator
MPLIRPQRVTLFLAVLLAAAMLGRAALPKSEEVPRAASLAGQLLIAAPEMGDPRFYRAVILVVQHSKDGALGIMINRPVGQLALASLLEAIGEKDAAVAGEVRVFAGGPVELQRGFVVHSAEYQRSGTIDIDGRVAMTASPEILRDIGHNKGPQKSLVAFGYAGWGPGQLEHELEQRAWFTAPEDPKLIFDEDRDNVWEGAMARRTLPL